ncbi:hypothetical protein RhiirA4_488157 [Rhizophagus irregularis]|uniref:BED-type domain-containing protein n=1 Tax=Rhizophagus irregularis TaxID=588596 RepID=A0A2I1HSF0_9GLOM|nr:hypothetical protein RhiirA4_487266 [Rhizophagus irregularis]PKY62154.1 hypothetical protein RhiirA4_488157 [Rhizophagus irregularis]
MTDSETDQTDEKEMGEEMEEENEEGDEHEVETMKKARCSYCKNLISCNKGSTTELSNHLKSKHSLTKDQEKG